MIEQEVVHIEYLLTLIICSYYLLLPLYSKKPIGDDSSIVNCKTSQNLMPQCKTVFQTLLQKQIQNGMDAIQCNVVLLMVRSKSGELTS